ncbi:MAG: EAL domain-containing protein [Devosia sp.]|uniref:putative bifunctional diguanylate cyclase/phosphodiesterase n=1 Tax=Devosia sp. TaxID=1871048 RepID=UPI001AC421BC|nr:EAL domain-containing protein [Devosia sp.]MBN9316703.1 EAL domain-containing protein [Devosia sp.]
MKAAAVDSVRKAADALLLDAALQAVPYGFCVWSPQFKLVMFNQHYLDIYGFSRKRVRKGMTLEAIVRLSRELGNHPDQTPEEFLAGYKRELLNNRGGARAKVRELVSGDRWIETAHVFSPGLGWVVTHEDVTEEIASTEIIQRRKRELERQNIRLDAAVNNISQGLCMYDARGRLVICNQPYQRIYNLPEHLLKPGTQLDDILGYLFDEGMQAGVNRDAYISWRREMIARGEYGKTIHELDGRTIMMQHHPMKDGGWVTTHEDITEQRQHEERIRHLARHDALTQLPNRVQFLEEMAAAEPGLERGDRIAVLCIDLDHFKAVNDTLGHSLGDKLLQQVSARLWGATREDDVLARLGGDEFALLLRDIQSPGEAAAIADRIVKAMSNPFTIDGHQLVIGTSVGIAMAPQDGDTAEILMKNADLALYRAKNEGRSTYHFFEPGMDAAIQKRRTIEAGLRLALARGEFRLVYQPLVGLKENRITCLEALLRWDSDRGVVSPAEFIPVAEETGLIVQIGDWVLREACRTAATWPPGVRVAVNLSAVQFKNKRLFETVEAALRETGLSPARLELEITESLLLSDNEPTLKTLHRLRALGVRISMDDFGTGYSSLSYLRSFPFDKIKIDRSFMRDLKSKGDSLAIIKAVIGLGHSLGMSTTAEGIETEEQLDAVRAQGCNEVQGFLFSPPVSASKVTELLAAEDRPRLRRVS